MAIARLHGGPLDGQVLPLDEPDQDTIIVPFDAGQLVYRRDGGLENAGDHDGVAEARFAFVESTETIGPDDDDR